MDTRIMNHYLEVGLFANLGTYADLIRRDLPDNVKDIGLRVRKSIIHRTTLSAGNTGTNVDLR
jgi:hypothetical protein